MVFKNNSPEKKPNPNLGDLEKKLQETTEALNYLKQNSDLQSMNNELRSDRLAELEEKKTKLEKQLKEKTEALNELEKELKETTQKYHELKQEKILLLDITETAEEEKKELVGSQKDLEERLTTERKKALEKEQERLLLEGSAEFEEKEKHAAIKKYSKAVIVSAIAIVIVVGVYPFLFAELAGQQYQVADLGPTNSGYTIQNLRGDTIDTWLSWRLVKDDILHIIIVNSDKYPEKVEIIKNAIQSTESIEIDDSLLHKGPSGVTSTYYLGWKGALEEASGTSTKFFIPKNLEVVESDRGEGDIIITLTDQKSGDGYSGFTKSIADETQNQILKSQITIYETSQLTDNQLSTIVRHELGHALGLAHSTAPEDLMHPTVKTEYPYISECDIDAITSLYDGNGSGQIVCEK